MAKIRYGIVGSGWRSEFYVRIAKALPEEFEAVAMLCRSEEKARLMAEKTGVRTTVSRSEFQALKPDFVVVAVDKPSIFPVARQWADKGIPVLCETPAGRTLEDLEDAWQLHCYGARLQVAEQYHRYPRYERILQAVESGKLGKIWTVSLSAAHDYHAVSLIRRILGVGFEDASFIGKRFSFPVTITGGREGEVFDGLVEKRDRVRMDLEFESGKAAFYDFSSVQYHSLIRSVDVRIQGERGEIAGNEMVYLDEENRPRRETLTWENPYGAQGLSEDETAVARMLKGMKEYIDTGAEVYPLAEALQDAYFALVMEKTLLHPYETLYSERQMWGY